MRGIHGAVTPSLGEIVLHGKIGGRSAGGDVKLAIDAFEVAANGFAGDGEVLRNFGISVAVGHQAKDFDFALGEVGHSLAANMGRTMTGGSQNRIDGFSVKAACRREAVSRPSGLGRSRWPLAAKGEMAIRGLVVRSTWSATWAAAFCARMALSVPSASTGPTDSYEPVCTLISFIRSDVTTASARSPACSPSTRPASWVWPRSPATSRVAS